MRTHDHKSRAFTLTELLVVIAVIGVLIGLTLPTLSVVRSRARTLDCVSKLRELTSAAIARAADTKGYLPLVGNVTVGPSVTGYGSLPRALSDPDRRRYIYVRQNPAFGANPAMELVGPPHAALLPYLGVKSNVQINDGTLSNWETFTQSASGATIFRCPAVEPIQGLSQYPYVGTSIGVVGSISLWDMPATYAFNGVLMGFLEDSRQRALRGQIGAIRNTSTLVFAADADPFRRSSSFFVWTDGRSLSSTIQLSLDNTGSSVLPGPHLDATRHRGSVNVAFLDGHVDTLQLSNRSALQSAKIAE